MFSLLSASAWADPVQHGQLMSGITSLFQRGEVDAVIYGAATYLFWSLTTISVVWTFGTMLLRRADFGELFLELVRFIVFNGLFFWLLLNAGSHEGFIYVIVDSFLKMAGVASADSAADSWVNMGLSVFYQMLEQSQNWSASDKSVGVALTLGTLIAFTLVAAQLVLVTIMAWMLAYGGIILLGFGGARWSSQMAVSYYKNVVAVGVAMLSLILMSRYALSMLQQLQGNFSAGGALTFVNMAEMFVVSLVMAVVGIKLPSLFYTLVTGSSLGIFSGTAAAAGHAIIVGSKGVAASVGGHTSEMPARRAEGRYENVVEAIRQAPLATQADSIYRPVDVAGHYEAATPRTLATPFTAAGTAFGDATMRSAEATSSSRGQASSGDPSGTLSERQEVRSRGDGERTREQKNLQSGPIEQSPALAALGSTSQILPANHDQLSTAYAPNADQLAQLPDRHAGAAVHATQEATRAIAGGGGAVAAMPLPMAAGAPALGGFQPQALSTITVPDTTTGTFRNASVDQPSGGKSGSPSMDAFAQPAQPPRPRMLATQAHDRPEAELAVEQPSPANRDEVTAFRDREQASGKVP